LTLLNLDVEYRVIKNYLEHVVLVHDVVVRVAALLQLPRLGVLVVVREAAAAGGQAVLA
jgi:hypothetical protein